MGTSVVIFYRLKIWRVEIKTYKSHFSVSCFLGEKQAHFPEEGAVVQGQYTTFSLCQD